jgi:uncharacterized protein YqeY
MPQTPTILQQITADITAARKAGNPDERDALVFLLAQARRPGKDNGNRDSTDNEVIGVIRKLISANDETVKVLTGTNRAAEIPLIEGGSVRMKRYLPAQMSEDEIRLHIQKFITGQNWSDEKRSMKWMGDVMTMLKETKPNQYDPGTASRIARELLAQ